MRSSRAPHPRRLSGWRRRRPSLQRPAQLLQRRCACAPLRVDARCPAAVPEPQVISLEKPADAWQKISYLDNGNMMLVCSRLRPCLHEA